jgi:hypothetical protein
MDEQWPIDSLQFLSPLLDLTHLVKISLKIYFNTDYASYTITAIIGLLKEMPNIHTLQSCNRTINSEIICAIIPRHVKHLKVKIDRIKDMKMILEQLHHLSSVIFQYPVCTLDYPTYIVKWLKQRRKSFTFWCNLSHIHLWFHNNI